MARRLRRGGRVGVCLALLAVACSAPPAPSGPPRVASRHPQPRIPLAVPPASRYAAAIDGGVLWLVTSADRSVATIDTQTLEPVGPPIAVPLEPVSIAVGEGGVWVVGLDHRRLLRIDPATRRVQAHVDIDSALFPEYEHLWVAAGVGYIWLIGQRHVVQIDPHTNRPVGEPVAAGEEIIAYALGAGALWTGSHDDGIVARVDPATTSVTARIQMGFSVHGLAYADGLVWVLDEHGLGVVGIDAATQQPAMRVAIDFVASNLAAGGGSVWVAAAAHNDGPTGMDWIARIDTATRRVEERLHVGGANTSDYFLALYQDGAAWALVSTPAPYIVRLDEAPQHVRP